MDFVQLDICHINILILGSVLPETAGLTRDTRWSRSIRAGGSDQVLSSVSSEPQEIYYQVQFAQPTLPEVDTDAEPIDQRAPRINLEDKAMLETHLLSEYNPERRFIEIAASMPAFRGVLVLRASPASLCMLLYNGIEEKLNLSPELTAIFREEKRDSPDGPNR